MNLAEARKIAIAAQGFGLRRMTDVWDRLKVIQIDSVNVLCRAHYMPTFSRIGPYDRSRLDRAAYQPERTLFEYWGHEASFLPIDLYPLFRWRMDQAKRGERIWGGVRRFAEERSEYCAEVLARVRAEGPLRASDIAEASTKKRGRWWSRSDSKTALEWLFWTGQLTTSSRHHFERVYDLPERVLPRRVLDTPPPPEDDAKRELLRFASRALGVATKNDLRDYFRLPPCDTLIADLVESGDLRPVKVEGWREPAFVAKGLRTRKLDVAALLSPFDPLVWYRARAHRLFDFHYRIEIYTPAHKRIHGYYVLPFLLGDRFVARVDLKRQGDVLEVAAAHVEAHAVDTDIVEPLAAELRQMMTWLGLARITVSRKGTLANALRSSLSMTRN